MDEVKKIVDSRKLALKIAGENGELKAFDAKNSFVVKRLSGEFFGVVLNEKELSENISSVSEIHHFRSSVLNIIRAIDSFSEKEGVFKGIAK